MIIGLPSRHIEKLNLGNRAKSCYFKRKS